MPVFPTVSGNSESNSQQTILFADDNSDFQQPVAALLYKRGYSVISARGGTDALEKARELDGPIHLLLSDVEMPGMSGIELAIQVNQERPYTKILLISAADLGLIVRSYGWQFIRKPFMFDMLRGRIRDILSEQPPTREHLLPCNGGTPFVRLLFLS